MNSVPQCCPPLSLSLSLRLTSWRKEEPRSDLRAPLLLKPHCVGEMFAPRGTVGGCWGVCAPQITLLCAVFECSRNLPESKRGALFAFIPSLQRGAPRTMAYLYNDVSFKFFSHIPEMSTCKSWALLRDEKPAYGFVYIFDNFHV